uniref:DEP domain-containing protein n=1 Tax=Erythrolobus madagascarensis TaxID=708628 RepID=A0A7S0T3R9_9RHOD
MEVAGGGRSAGSSMSSIRVASYQNLVEVGSQSEVVGSFEAIVESLRSGLTVADRVYRLKKYERTFVGSDAARRLIAAGFATSVADAVALGNQLAQRRYFVDVSLEGDDALRFENGYKLYRFTQDDRILKIRDILPAGTEFASVEAKFLETVPMRDRRQGLHVHRCAFMGIEAVSVIIKLGFAQSRADATRVCQGLMDSGCFVTAGSHAGHFSDSVQLYKVFPKAKDFSGISEVSSPFTPRVAVRS